MSKYPCNHKWQIIVVEQSFTDGVGQSRKEANKIVAVCIKCLEKKENI